MAFSRSKVLEQARKHIEKKQLKKAVQQYELVRSSGEATTGDRLTLAELYREVGDTARGLMALLEVARDYVVAGQPFRAVAVYKHMLRIDPRLYPVHSALARVYQDTGYLNDAISQHQEAIGVLSVRGQPVERLNAIRELLALDPENVRARVRLAEDYAGEGILDAATREFRVVIELLDKRGLNEEYVKVAERLLHFAPDDVGVSRRLARFYLEMDSPQLALPRLQVVYRVNTGDVEVLEMLAACFEAIGQGPKALTVLKELARTHDRNGLIIERNQVLERVVALDPTDEWARRAIAGRAIDPIEELGFQELSFDELEDAPVTTSGSGDSGPRPSPASPAAPVAAAPTAPAGLPELRPDEGDMSILGRTSLQKGLDELDDLMSDFGPEPSVAPAPPAPARTSGPPPLPPPPPLPVLPSLAVDLIPEVARPSPSIPEVDHDAEQEAVEFGFDELYEVPPHGRESVPEGSVASADFGASLTSAAPGGSDDWASDSTDPGLAMDPSGIPHVADEPMLDLAAPPEPPGSVSPTPIPDARGLTPPRLAPPTLDVPAAPEAPDLVEFDNSEFELVDPVPEALGSLLAEVDFFFGRGSLDDAAQVLAEVPSEFEAHPAVVERLQKLTAPS